MKNRISIVEYIDRKYVLNTYSAEADTQTCLDIKIKKIRETSARIISEGLVTITYSKRNIIMHHNEGILFELPSNIHTFVRLANELKLSNTRRASTKFMLREIRVEQAALLVTGLKIEASKLGVYIEELKDYLA